MAILFTNNAYGSLSGSISAAATTINLASGNGARFPNPGGSDYFLATLIGLDGSGNENSWEIVKVTGRSTDSLTVVRGQEGTTAAIWASGTRIELRVTKGTLEALPQGVIGTDIQAYDGDLAAIAALAGTSGFLKKTGTNTWSLDTSTYLTGNQSITLSGDASGSGSTAITVTLATVTAAKGGTGQTSYTIGDILYASGATALSKLAGVATGNALISGGVGTAPSWGKVGLTTHISGTLAVSNGGTGATTLTGLVKGNGTSAFTAAVAGTDYVTPAGLTAFTGSSNIATVGTITNALYRHKPATNVNLFAEDGGGFYSDYAVQDNGTTYIARKIGGSTVTLQSSSSDVLTVSSTGAEFVGTSKRITGDMSNATLASRLAFQTSTTNGTTAVSAIANGTGTASYFIAFAGSDSANAAYGWLSATASGVDIYSDKTGTGSVQPIRLLTGGTVRASVGALGGFDLATGLREFKVAMGANEIDLRAGNYFTKTFTAGSFALTAANVPAANTAASFILDATNAGLATITFSTGFTSVKWVGGTQPTLTSSGRDVLGFFTHDGGATWTGLLLGKDVK